MALEYLEAIGVDPSRSVRLVVASHWHDDHIRGIARLLAACPAAAFSCSEALLKGPLLEIVLAGSSRSMMHSSSGVHEFAAVVAELRGRAAASRPNLVGSGILYAGAARRLWQRISPTDPAEVWSLSPSGAEYEAALVEFSRLMPMPASRGVRKVPRRRIMPVRPNNVAVALWVQIGAVKILLGADLEEPGHADTGWSAVVGSSGRPQGQASLLKVAHHGSETAHRNGVWSTMLIPKPLAVLTPFRKGSVVLPKDTDVARLKAQTTELYTSMNRAPRKARSSSRTITRAFKDGTCRIRRVPVPGRVSARTSGGNWSVNTADGASQL